MNPLSFAASSALAILGFFFGLAILLPLVATGISGIADEMKGAVLFGSATIVLVLMTIVLFWTSLARIRTSMELGRGLLRLFVLSVVVTLGFLIGLRVLLPPVTTQLTRIEDALQGPVLFGAATVILAVLALGLAGFAFFGIQTVKILVERETARRFKDARDFDVASNRVDDASILSLVGEYFTEKYKDPLFFARMALPMTSRALQSRSLREPREENARRMAFQAKNNKAFLLALLNQWEDAHEAIRLAKEASDTPGPMRSRAASALTLGRVLATFAGHVDEKPNTLRAVKERLERFFDKGAFDSYQKKEFRRTRKLLKKAIEDLEER